MIVVLVIMAIGILLGFSFRNRKQLAKPIDRITSWAIYLLLFLLGLSVGNNPTLLNHFGKIGITALLLTLGAVLGSVVLAYIVYIVFFKNSSEV